MSEKAFCNKCWHHGTWMGDMGLCNSPNNICDTHWGAGCGRIKSRAEKNANNDCSDYKEIRYKWSGPKWWGYWQRIEE
jgi:hypothetical protein